MPPSRGKPPPAAPGTYARAGVGSLIFGVAILMSQKISESRGTRAVELGPVVSWLVGTPFVVLGIAILVLAWRMKRAAE